MGRNAGEGRSAGSSKSNSSRPDRGAQQQAEQQRSDRRPSQGGGAGGKKRREEDVDHQPTPKRQNRHGDRENEQEEEEEEELSRPARLRRSAFTGPSDLDALDVSCICICLMYRFMHPVYYAFITLCIACYQVYIKYWCLAGCFTFCVKEETSLECHRIYFI